MEQWKGEPGTGNASYSTADWLPNTYDLILFFFKFKKYIECAIKLVVVIQVVYSYELSTVANTIRWVSSMAPAALLLFRSLKTVKNDIKTPHKSSMRGRYLTRRS